MSRILLLLAAAAAAATLPVAPAHASPICEDVAVTGVVNLNPPMVCVPYLFNTSCSTGSTGLPGLVVVHDVTCIPATSGTALP